MDMHFLLLNFPGWSEMGHILPSKHMTFKHPGDVLQALEPVRPCCRVADIFKMLRQELAFLSHPSFSCAAPVQILHPEGKIVLHKVFLPSHASALSCSK